MSFMNILASKYTKSAAVLVWWLMHYTCGYSFSGMDLALLVFEEFSDPDEHLRVLPHMQCLIRFNWPLLCFAPHRGFFS